MAFPSIKFSRGEVNRAGVTLISPQPGDTELRHAVAVLSNWRACHGYPINTFQMTLRDKLDRVSTDYLVAQRLKRFPSIVAKLRRFPQMNLARMQDIGGLRAIVDSVDEAEALRQSYLRSKFLHQLVANTDYMATPKSSGYRGFHLVYKYQGRKMHDYDGLQLELQIRTRNKHAWATAVETAGTFLDQSLKSSEGPAQWLEFFALASAGFAIQESRPKGEHWADIPDQQVCRMIQDEERRLRVTEKLSAFRVAVDAISSDKRAGSYHLIVLDPTLREVQIQSYSHARLENATRDYAVAEDEVASGAVSQAVLVSTSSIDDLRRAYPNYFLDTSEFFEILAQITDGA